MLALFRRSIPQPEPVFQVGARVYDGGSGFGTVVGAEHPDGLVPIGFDADPQPRLVPVWHLHRARPGQTNECP